MALNIGVNSDEGGIIRATQMILPSTATGVISNGFTRIQDSVIFGPNIGIIHNGTGFLEFLDVINCDIRGRDGGAIVIQNSAGATISGGWLIGEPTAIRQIFGKIVVATTRVDGAIIGSSNKIKLIYCYDKDGNPVTFP